MLSERERERERVGKNENKSRRKRENAKVFLKIIKKGIFFF